MRIKTNEIIQWDCLSVLKEMKDEVIDLTVTSPPYDNLRTYNGYSFDFEWIAKELFRVTKEWWVVVWVVWDQTIKWSESGTSFRQALYFKEIGFNLHDTMIYQKPNAPLSHNRYEQEFEYMFVFSKWKLKTFNWIKDKVNKYAGNTVWWTKRDIKTGKLRELSWHKKWNFIAELWLRTNIWNIPNRWERNWHPAIFPEKLAEDHILSWSNPWDIVLDPFAWSGTTLKMAKKNGRDYVWIEISEEYIEIINNRLK